MPTLAENVRALAACPPVLADWLEEFTTVTDAHLLGVLRGTHTVKLLKRPPRAARRRGIKGLDLPGVLAEMAGVRHYRGFDLSLAFEPAVFWAYVSFEQPGCLKEGSTLYDLPDAHPELVWLVAACLGFCLADRVPAVRIK